MASKAATPTSTGATRREPRKTEIYSADPPRQPRERRTAFFANPKRSIHGSSAYLRRVGDTAVSPFTGRPIVADWPVAGPHIDAVTYVALNALHRSSVKNLPYNVPGTQDGVDGGWSQWSAPLSFVDGLVDENGVGDGVSLPLPPLSRYVQLRFDFIRSGESGVSLDYVEFDFSSPFVDGGIFAEIFPDTAASLGESTSFQYTIRPQFASNDAAGFNRIELAVPSLDAAIDSLLFDDLAWRRIDPDVPADVGDEEAAARGDSLRRSANWLRSVVVPFGSYAAVVSADSVTGRPTLSIKTSTLDASDFPPGQKRDLRLRLRSPVFSLLTEFRSWVWNDDLGTTGSQQRPRAPAAPAA